VMASFAGSKTVKTGTALGLGMSTAQLLKTPLKNFEKFIRALNIIGKKYFLTYACIWYCVKFMKCFYKF
jgi:hypothetical protein